MMGISPSSAGLAGPLRHPFLLNIAVRLLSKAERSATSGPIRLELDRKTAPELYDAVDNEQAQLLRMQIEDLCATKWVALRLKPSRAFATFIDRKPRLELCNFDALAAWAGYVPRAQHWQQQWQVHLAAHWAAHPEIAPTEAGPVLDYLARNPLTQMEGMALNEATQGLSGLVALCRACRPMFLREASAKVFQGRSKILDRREELLRLLGAESLFTESPIQLLLAPPASDRASGETFNDVLFIENLTTFEHMADVRAPAWEDSLLVYAAGFRGSARRLRSRTGCRLYLRAFAPTSLLPAIEAWLFTKEEGDGVVTQQHPVRFFGDLDYSGMQIIASLREVFSSVEAWRPGYAYLVRLLSAGGGHPPDMAAKTKQIDPGQVGCVYTDEELLPLMRKLGRFIDQEAFDPERIGVGRREFD